MDFFIKVTNFPKFYRELQETGHSTVDQVLKVLQETGHSTVDQVLIVLQETGHSTVDQVLKVLQETGHSTVDPGTYSSTESYRRQDNVHNVLLTRYLKDPYHTIHKWISKGLVHTRAVKHF